MPLGSLAKISRLTLHEPSRWLACVLALALASFGTAAAGAKAVHLHKPPVRQRCLPKRSQILGDHGMSVLFVRQTGPDDGKYGAPHRLYGCQRARQAPVDLFEFEDGDMPSIVVTSFDGSYAAFFLGWESSTCAFYESAGAENCGQSLFESVSLNNGRIRVMATDENPSAALQPDALVVTHSGWIAWVETGTSGTMQLLAQDSKGQRTLDPGPIDARSLRVSGKAVRWTDAGVAHSAVLG